MSLALTGVYRIMDANFNRAQEGLRVCEDICRFILDHKSWTSRYKNIRHHLTRVGDAFKRVEWISSRDILHDQGKQTISSELKRRNYQDIYFANSQRVKESVRVLEEFSKLLKKKSALDLKQIRYQVYALEKEIIERI